MGSSSNAAVRTRLLTAISVTLNICLFGFLLHAWMERCEQIDVQYVNVKQQNAYPQPTNQQVQPLNIQNLPVLPNTNTRHLLSTNQLLPTPSTTTGSQLGILYTPPPPSSELDIKNDLSMNTSFHHSEHEFTWHYCEIKGDEYHPDSIPFCSIHPKSEQKYQMGWYGDHVVPNGSKHPLPGFMKCVNLPPNDYQWPEKYPQLPATSDAVHWPNLRVKSLQDLTIFNQAYPKNLYHFDAVKYDQDALDELKLASKYIPFASKIRLMLDVGAGGGSLGLLLKRKYDVQTLSTIFADWPYCEYITLRGGNCMLVDTMEAMPFAKFSFDVLHVSWIYHGQQVEELMTMCSELNRVLRPGGYIWMRGGWSLKQVDAMKLLFEQLGYQSLFDEIKHKPQEIQQKVSFGPGLPYQVDWNCIFVKPIRAERRTDCPAKTEKQ